MNLGTWWASEIDSPYQPQLVTLPETNIAIAPENGWFEYTLED